MGFGSLGKTLLIVNPAAKNGSVRDVASRVVNVLENSDNTLEFVLRETQEAMHAVRIASESADYDTVIALGGDGLVHEIVNGLMRIEQGLRPRLGLIPCGSGNDFAHTVNMSVDVEKSLVQLFETEESWFDVGVCNGEYFCETLSFGLDAAIALDTVERRKRTGKSGTALYAASGIDQLLHHLDIHHAKVRFDDAPVREVDLHLIAVQIGQTYGGGFMVCPEADPTDGFFDTCIATAPMSLFSAAKTFALAKGGHHTGCKNIELGRAQKVELEFSSHIPTQIDGEKMDELHYSISCIPNALRVLRFVR